MADLVFKPRVWLLSVFLTTRYCFLFLSVRHVVLFLFLKATYNCYVSKIRPFHSSHTHTKLGLHVHRDLDVPDCPKSGSWQHCVSPIPDSVIPMLLALLISWPWFAASLSSVPGVSNAGKTVDWPLPLMTLDLQSHSHTLSQEPTFSTVLKLQASSLEVISLASTGASQINTSNIKPWYHLYAVISSYLTEFQVCLASPLLLTTGFSLSTMLQNLSLPWNSPFPLHLMIS